VKKLGVIAGLTRNPMKKEVNYVSNLFEVCRGAKEEGNSQSNIIFIRLYVIVKKFLYFCNVKVSEWIESWKTL